MENMQKSLLNLISSAGFQKLSHSEKKFNIFSSLGMWSSKSVYMDFLYWLLNPKENHALGDMFFKELLEHIGSIDISIDYKYRPLLYADMSDLEVKWDELKGSVIIIKSEKNEMACFLYDEPRNWEYSCPFYTREGGWYDDYKYIMHLRFSFKRVCGNKRYYKGWIGIDYGVVCDIIDKILKTVEDGYIDNEIRLFLTYYKEMTEEYFIENVDSITAVCHKIYSEYKEAIDNIFQYGRRPQYFVLMLFKEVLDESELFEYTCFCHNEYSDKLLCLPCGIDEDVREKLRCRGSSPLISKKYVGNICQISFGFFIRESSSIYFGLDFIGIKDEDILRKSLENELNIKIISGEWWSNKHKIEALFTLDILEAGNKDEIKAAMKKIFDEKCVPYIEKFAAAVNKAGIV